MHYVYHILHLILYVVFPIFLSKLQKSLHRLQVIWSLCKFVLCKQFIYYYKQIFNFNEYKEIVFTLSVHDTIFLNLRNITKSFSTRTKFFYLKSKIM